MTATLLLGLLAVGVAVGFLSALVGIGGGVLMVPFLYFFYAHGWGGVAIDPALHAVVAHATSLFVIVPTAVRGTWAYHRAGLVVWRVVPAMALGSIVAAALGASLALQLPAELLKLIFGIVLVGTSVQTLRGRVPAPRDGQRWSTGLALAIGAAMGGFSALLGIGGGLVGIPLMIYLLRLDLDRVAATSIAVIVAAATAGVATYAVAGAGAADMPAGSLGFVHVAAAVPMMIGALVSVPLGARLNQRMETRRLRLIFGLLFLVVGLDLIIENAGALA